MVKIDDDIRMLRVKISKMASISINMVEKASEGLFERKSELLEDVIKTDNLVDEIDNDIDQTVVRICAIRHPEASDLRFILSCVKANVAIERVADNAVNIAEWALKINRYPQLKPYIDLPKMRDIAVGMVRDAVDSFLDRNVDRSREIIKKDEIVDNLEIQVIRELMTYIVEDAHNIKTALRLMYVARAFERIADQATNIAELAIFTATGEIVKHRRKKE